MNDRVRSLRALMAQCLPRVGALLIGRPENMRYLSGFRGDVGFLWVTATDAAILTDSRFWLEAEQEAPGWRLVRVERADAVEFIAGLCAKAQADTLAFEPGWVTYGEYRSWRRRLKGVRLLPAPELVERLRVVKDPGELAAIRRAAEVVDRVFGEWLPCVRAGAVETELAADFEHRLRLHGAEGVAFPPVVAGGPRGAMAHAIPERTTLAGGDVLVVDVGAVVDGYRSDMTRTVLVPGGKPQGGVREVFGIVESALAAGIAAAIPGNTAVAVDTAVRAVIETAGYGPQFGHGSGHGVGLAVHEAPRLSPGADPKVRLPEGAVVTIEPGIYLPGRFGVRLEQLVRVGPSGAEVLSGTPVRL